MDTDEADGKKPTDSNREGRRDAERPDADSQGRQGSSERDDIRRQAEELAEAAERMNDETRIRAMKPGVFREDGRG
jgi:hypothetical protein